MHDANQGNYGEGNHCISQTTQGRFGEGVVSISKDTWTCPECETHNTGEVCILCGYTKTAKTHKHKKVRIGTAVIVAIVFAAVVFSVFALNPNQTKYEQACKYLSQEQFEEASSLFAELGDYKDSGIKQTEAIYAWAESLLAEKKYDDALDKLGQIPGYENIEVLVTETKYQRAKHYYGLATNTVRSGREVLYNAGNPNNTSNVVLSPFQEAYQEFENLSGYKDADDLKAKLILDWAEDILTGLNNDSMQDARLFARTIGVIPEDRSREIYELIISIDHYDTNTSKKSLGGGFHPVDFSVRKLLLERLTGNVPHKDELSRLFDAFSDEYIGLNNQILDNSDLIRALWEDIPVVKNVVEDYWNIEGWLWGKWESSTNEYIQFQGQKTKYNLPADTKPQQATRCSISWMEFYWQDENENRLQNPFRISLISPDTIEVYCYKNGETYTLHRSK